MAVDAAVDRPFGEHGGAGLELARLPGFGEVVFVGVVLDQAATGVLEIPKVGRRDGVAARAELGGPAAAAHVQAAAKHLVNVTHGKGHVVQAHLAGGQLQQKQVVVAALRGAAHEHAPPGVAVRGDKTQRGVKGLHLGQPVGEEHHMPDLHRLRPLVHRRRRVDALHLAPGVAGRTLQRQRPLGRFAKHHAQTLRVQRADAGGGADATIFIAISPITTVLREGFG